jgi:hypothetical protein
MENVSTVININNFNPNVYFEGFLDYRQITNPHDIESDILSDNSYRLYTLYNECNDDINVNYDTNINANTTTIKQLYYLTKKHNLPEKDMKDLTPFCECRYHKLPSYFLCFRQIICCPSCNGCVGSEFPSEYNISKAIKNRKNKHDKNNEHDKNK